MEMRYLVSAFAALLIAGCVFLQAAHSQSVPQGCALLSLIGTLIIDPQHAEVDDERSHVRTGMNGRKRKRASWATCSSAAPR
jgi:hypothetical protein